MYLYYEIIIHTPLIIRGGKILDIYFLLLFFFSALTSNEIVIFLFVYYTYERDIYIYIHTVVF